MPISRRRFVRDTGAALAVVSFADWLERANTPPAPSRIRYGLDTKEGRDNLTIFATAVRRMKDLSGDAVLPFNSWTAQYKLHLYPDNADLFDQGEAADLARLRAAQAAEIDHFYPAAKAELADKRQAADKTWGRCPHGEPDFLPWHRMYLYFFEQTVRKVANAPGFTLPYWGYSEKAQRTIPRSLRVPLVTGLVENPLYHGRNLLLNDLNNPLPIDDSNIENPSPLDRYWHAPTFEDFSKRAEGIPHNRVHVALGTNIYDGFDMFRIGMSPRDPIFWLHHCEMDRIWHSWTVAGGAGPASTAAWLDRPYYFIDADGALVSITGRDVLETSQLDYTYDRAIAKPPTAAGLTLTQAGASTERTVAESTNVRLVGRATDLRLSGSAGPPGLLTTDNIGTRRLLLRLEGVEATRPFTANLDVFLNLPENSSDQQRRDSLVGVIGVFGALRHSADHRQEYQFDATPVVRRLLSLDRWTSPPRVTVLVSGGSLRSAEVTIERVRLVAVGE